MPVASLSVTGMADALRRVGIALQRAHPQILSVLAPGASDGQLDAMERDIGHPLPAALRVLLAWHDGVTAEETVVVKLDGLWEPMSVREIVRAVRAMRDALRAKNRPCSRTWWSPDWVPFLHDGFGNYRCVDPIGQDTVRPGGGRDRGTAGQVVSFDYEARHRVVEAPSLQTWLAALADVIEGSLVRPEVVPTAWGVVHRFGQPEGQDALADAVARRAPGYPCVLS